MTKTHIIGHRGAAGLALENTMASFKKAIELGVTIIEFDVHTTSDGVFVVCHDNSLERVSDSKVKVKETTVKDLQAIPLHNNEHVPLLTDVLDLARKHQIALIVEAKAIDDPLAFCAILDRYQDIPITVASFKYSLLTEIRRLRPNYRLYLAEQHQPVHVLRAAKRLHAQGIDLQYMLLNPFTYILAQIWHLDIMVFTVNKPLIARFLQILYPKIYMCTNYPDRLLHKRFRP